MVGETKKPPTFEGTYDPKEGFDLVSKRLWVESAEGVAQSGVGENLWIRGFQGTKGRRGGW